MLILLEDYLYIFCVIGLGDFFLENLQGLTTLKIYQADQQKAEDDACRMEHIVSDDSIICLNSFLRNDGRYQRAITGYNLHSRYAVGTYPGIMGIYQISEETCPRRLAEEFYDYKRDILLNVELGKSHFVNTTSSITSSCSRLRIS